MKVAFVINDFDSMNIEKDTSIFLMNEAYNRGYEVFSFGVNEVTYNLEKKEIITNINNILNKYTLIS